MLKLETKLTTSVPASANPAIGMGAAVVNAATKEKSVSSIDSELELEYLQTERRIEKMIVDFILLSLVMNV